LDSDLSGIIKQNTHFFKVRVFYEDTDFTGIVYHANYLKFAERGRTNFLRLLDINHSELIDCEDPKFFVVYKMKSKFLGTSSIDDILEVRSVFKGIEGVRLKIDQDIFLRGFSLFGLHLQIFLNYKDSSKLTFVSVNVLNLAYNLFSPNI